MQGHYFWYCQKCTKFAGVSTLKALLSITSLFIKVMNLPAKLTRNQDAWNLNALDSNKNIACVAGGIVGPREIKFCGAARSERRSREKYHSPKYHSQKYHFPFSSRLRRSLAKTLFRVRLQYRQLRRLIKTQTKTNIFNRLHFPAEFTCRRPLAELESIWTWTEWTTLQKYI